jgi:RHS repeat-associated protein
VNFLGQRDAVDLDLDSDVDGSGLVSSDVDWGYNLRGELIEADHEIVAHERAYKFDAIGNRKETVSGTTTLTGTDDYAANIANEYTEVEGSTTGLAYDASGNLTGDGTLEYFWDGENRLVRVTDGTNTLAEYAYDYQGRRIAKTSTANAPQGAGNRIYFYHGWNLIAEYTADSGWTNEDLDFNYTWGLDLSQSLQGAGGVGGLLVAEKVSTGNTDEYYPTYDGNGNVSEFINSSGTQVPHYEDDAFGNQLSLSSGSLKDLFAHRFSTKYHDEETGFYYYGYRYYDPVTGRWPSRDPIEERGGINLYGMVGNDAVGRWDYLGLKSITDSTWEEDPNSSRMPWGENGQVGEYPMVRNPITGRMEYDLTQPQDRNPQGYSGSGSIRAEYPDSSCNGEIIVTLTASANGNWRTQVWMGADRYGMNGNQDIAASHQDSSPGAGPRIPVSNTLGAYNNANGGTRSTSIKIPIKCEYGSFKCCDVDVRGTLSIFIPNDSLRPMLFGHYAIRLKGDDFNCKYKDDTSTVSVEFR